MSNLDTRKKCSPDDGDVTIDGEIIFGDHTIPKDNPIPVIVCQPVTVIVDGEVTVAPNGDWAALLEAALTAALEGFDFPTIDVNVTGGDITITSPVQIDPDQWQALLDALTDLEVTIANTPIEITGTVTIDGTIDANIANLAELAAALDGLNVNATITNTKDNPVPVEVCNTVTVTGDVNATITNVAELAAAIGAELSAIFDEPIEVVITNDGAIEVIATLDPDTIAALVDALNNLEVTIANTPLEITGSVTIDGTVDAQITNFDDLIDLLGDLTLDVNVTNTDPIPTEISNWDDMPLGIEASLAPVGCTYDEDGNKTGSIFLCKIVDEETGAETFAKKWTGINSAAIVDYDPAVHGDESECEPEAAGIPQCVKWASNVIFVDNTGFGLNETFTISIENSDGTTATTTIPSAASWTANVDAITAALAALYPDAVVESRCNTPTGCGGLLPPPSDAQPPSTIIARYTSLVFCPTATKTPINITITDSSNPKRIGRVLTLESIQTPEKRGWICAECGEVPILYDSNWEPVPAADLPACWFECSETIPQPTAPTCNHTTVTGCDNGTEPPTDIIRIYTECDGVITFADYIENADGGLDDYTLIGEFELKSGTIPTPNDCYEYYEEGCALDVTPTYQTGIATLNSDGNWTLNFPSGAAIQLLITQTNNTLQYDVSGGLPRVRGGSAAVDFNWQATYDTTGQTPTQIADCLAELQALNFEFRDMDENTITAVSAATGATGTGTQNGLTFTAGAGNSSYTVLYEQPSPSNGFVWSGTTSMEANAGDWVAWKVQECWLMPRLKLIADPVSQSDTTTKWQRVTLPCWKDVLAYLKGIRDSLAGTLNVNVVSQPDLPLTPCQTCTVLPYSAGQIIDSPIVEIVGGTGSPQPLPNGPFSTIQTFAADLAGQGYSVEIIGNTIEVCGGSDPVIGYVLDDGTVIDATEYKQRDGLLVCDPNTAALSAQMNTLIGVNQTTNALLAELIDCLCNCPDDDDPCDVDIVATDSDGNAFAPIGDAGPNQNFPAPAANDSAILSPTYQIQAPYPECASGTVRLKLAFDHETDGGVYGGTGGGHDGFIVAAPVGGTWVTGSETNGIVNNGTSITVGQRDNTSPYTLDRRIRCVELDVPVATVAAGFTLQFAAFGSVSNGGEILHGFTVTQSAVQTALDCSGCSGGDDGGGEKKNCSVQFKTSGLVSVLTDKGEAISNGPHDFPAPNAPPQSSANDAAMTAAAADIQVFLDANGGGTVELEYISTSILEIRIIGTTCTLISADDDSNPGPHEFTCEVD